MAWFAGGLYRDSVTATPVDDPVADERALRDSEPDRSIEDHGERNHLTRTT